MTHSEIADKLMIIAPPKTNKKKLKAMHKLNLYRTQFPVGEGVLLSSDDELN